MSSATPAAIDARIPVATAHREPKRQHVHIPPLDGIRGIAILLVMTGHVFASFWSEWAPMLPAPMRFLMLGWMGVDLFFVLSGFLITGILLDAKGSDHYFKNFYARRALRIFPLYYVAFAVALIFQVITSISAVGSEHPAWLLFYLTNFRIAIEGAGSFDWFDHYWSLAVEEHFYLVWPAIVFFFRRKAVMYIAGASLIVAFLVRVSCVVDGQMNMMGYMATFARMDSLAAGALLALAVRGPKGIAPFAKPAFFVFTGCILAFLLIAGYRDALEPHDMYLGTIGISLLWMAFTSLIVISLTWKPATQLTSSKPLRWFGKYSYGMYVWHPPIFILVFHVLRPVATGNPMIDSFGNLAVGLAALLAVSLLSWHLMEKQLLKLKRYFA